MNNFKGAGGGGGGSTTFRNRPDNLRSTDTFEALIGLVTGRIRGLAPGGLKNYLINGVPMEDGSGNKTLDEFNILLYNGDPATLAPIKLQLGGSSGTTSVNLAVDNANTGATTTAGPAGDWRFGVVDTPNVDYIDLRFIVSELFTQTKSGIDDGTASLEIQLQASGTSEWINPLLDVTAPTYSEDGFPVSYGPASYQVYAPVDAWDGSNWAEPAAGFLQITGKTTQAYVKELRIAVPKLGAYEDKTWQVRVRLMERDSFTDGDNAERRTIVWESIAGVDADTFGDTEDWRGLAYIQISGKASDQLNGIPTLEGIFDLCEVKVPPSSVWDAETRVYTGAAWDGVTEEIRWTTCPAFQLKDLIEDDISGISALTPGSTLNKWDALEASKWYSELVPDGTGGEHCRYSMHPILDTQMSVEETVQYIAGATGSYAWDRGDGQWRLVVDKPETPTALFTKENIVGEFSYSHTDIDSRYNEIIGVFVNEDMGYAEDRVRVWDQPHIDAYGKRSTSLALVGCTNRQEALRRVKLRQLSSLYETKQITYVTNRQGTLVQPFSVVLIADGDLGTFDERTTGRLVYRDGLKVTVRDKVHLEPGISYLMHVTVPNPDYDPDTTGQPSSSDWKKPTITITREITNTTPQRGDVRILYIDEALPDDTPLNAPIAFEAIGLPAMPKQYRVLGIEPDQSNDEMITISAVEIYTAKWDESDEITEDAIIAQVPKQVPSPTDLSLSIDEFQANFQTKRVISAQWQRPSTLWFQGFKVEYTLNGGPPVVMDPNTQSTFVELQNPESGLYEFRIYTLDRRGGVSLPVKDTLLFGEIPPAGTTRIESSDTNIVFSTDSSGTPLLIPYDGWVKFMVGDADVSADTTWSIDPYGASATIDTDGTWHITDITSSSRIIITGVYGGVTLNFPITTTLNSVAGGSGGGGGAPAGAVDITDFPYVSSTTYPTDPTTIAVVNSGASGAITFSASLLYFSSGASLVAKMVYRPTSGGAWTDVTSETTGSTAEFGESGGYGIPISGNLSISDFEITGLTASTDYDFGIKLRKYVGSTGDIGIDTPSYARAIGNT